MWHQSSKSLPVHILSCGKSKCTIHAALIHLSPMPFTENNHVLNHQTNTKTGNQMELIPKTLEPQPRNDLKPKAQWRMGKRWRKVTSESHPNNLKGQNNTIEIIYHNALRMIKEQFLEPGMLYFERDYKEDNCSPFDMHTFACDKVYFHLECDFHYFMNIQFDFIGFTLSDNVLRQVAYAVELGLCNQKPCLPDLPTFFKGVQAYQEPQYIHIL
jgi:hypothetical protein